MEINKKRLDVVVIIVTVLVVGLLAWVYFSQMKPQPAQAPVPNPITDLPTSQVPPAMPQDIVLASDAQVIHSYTATTPAGNQQATLIYQSAETRNQLSLAYFQYFVKNGWALKTSVLVGGTSTKEFPKDSYSLLGANSSSTATLSVGISPVASSSDWMVAITMINL